MCISLCYLGDFFESLPIAPNKSEVWTGTKMTSLVSSGKKWCIGFIFFKIRPVGLETFLNKIYALCEYLSSF